MQAVKRRLISDVPAWPVFERRDQFQRRPGRSGAGTLIRIRFRLLPLASTNRRSTNPITRGASLASFGTRHHEEKLDLDSARALIPEVLGRLDEPLADPSIIPTFLLSRFTRKYVTVALSGDGGDELFAGYDPFKALGPARLYQLFSSPRAAPRIAPACRSVADFARAT